MPTERTSAPSNSSRASDPTASISSAVNGNIPPTLDLKDLARPDHPWIFRSEIRGQIPRQKGFVRLPTQDLAYFRPGATLAARVFRGLRRVSDLMTWATSLFERAAQKRLNGPYKLTSARLFHGEADGISGLVIDRYVLATVGDVLVIQLQNEAAESLRESIQAIVGSAVGVGTTVVLRSDSRARARDNLPIDDAEILILGQGHSTELLRSAQVVVNRLGVNLSLCCDLLEGQKTGLFLDQVENAVRLGQLIPRLGLPGELRVLDLFCYVGLWSRAIQAATLGTGKTLTFVGIDRSEQALANYRANVAAPATTDKRDFLNDAADSLLPPESFDVVLCDPPALMTSRDHRDSGLTQYRKLFARALRATRSEGIVVLSSCSQLLSPDDFRGVIGAAAGAARVTFEWVAQGTQAADHPIHPAFEASEYLKSAVIRVQRARDAAKSPSRR